jgi:hypothetical protein
MGCEASDATVPSTPHYTLPDKFEDSYYQLLKPACLMEANKLFAHGEYPRAAAIYQQYIEDHGNEVPAQIDGMGQLLIALGYYQWNLYKHYREGI